MSVPQLGGSGGVALALTAVLLILSLLVHRLSGMKLASAAAIRADRTAAALSASNRWQTDLQLNPDFLSWALFAHIPAQRLSLEAQHAAHAREAVPPTFDQYQETATGLEQYLAQTFPGIRESTTFRSRDQGLYYHRIAADLRVKTVCETGFNGGHSAVNWLSANPKLHVYSFDLGAHRYVDGAYQYVQERFPGRLNLTLGDSTEQVPQFAQDHPEIECQVIHVDGGHTYEVAMLDTLGFLPMADPEFHVLLMDDVGCDFNTSCAGPSRTIQEGVESGVLDVQNFTQVEVSRIDAGGYPQDLIPTRGYIKASYIL